jgi:predicted P-loop ATPase
MLGTDLQSVIKAFKSFGLPVVKTKSKAPIVNSWQELANNIDLWAGNLSTATEAGFVITDGYVVIDIDPRNFNAGIDSLELLEKAIGFDLEINAGLVVETASGGKHLYYKKESDVKFPNTHQDFKGVEFKQKGQQVILPNSVLPDGRKYSFISGSLQKLSESKLPKSFYDIIGSKIVSKPISIGSSFTNSPSDIAKLKRLLTNIPPAVQGNNGDQATYNVCCLGKDYGISPDVFFELLCEWNEKCSPPWSLEELKTKMLNAYSYSRNTVGSHSLESMFINVEKPTFLDSSSAKAQEEELLDWQAELQVNKNGGYKTTLKNAVLFIKNDEYLKGKLGYDEFTNDIVWISPPFWRDKESKFNLDFDGVKIRMLLNNHGFDIGKNLIEEAVVEIASTNKFNPVKDWLAKLPKWDGVSRVEKLLVDTFDIEDNIYHRELMKVFFSGLLNRIYNPGIKFDFMLVLSGQTRSGKSTFLKSICPFESNFLSRQLTGLDPKDYVPLMKGKLIFEWQELAMFSRHDINSIKTFISTEVDTVREAYRRDAYDYRRQFVICGTTNKEQFLLDETGNERFYIVKVNRKLEGKDYITTGGVEYIRNIRSNIEQIYAEALTFYKKQPLTLSEAARKIVLDIREDAFLNDEIEETIVEWLENIPEDISHICNKHELQVKDIIIHCFKEVPSKSRGLSNRIANVLRRLGYVRKTFRQNGVVKQGFLKK